MAVTVDNALDSISNISHDLKFEIIPIEECVGRVCAEQIFARYALPKFNNSAMDGYAIKYEEKDDELEILDTIFAGDNNDILLDEKTCIKIMTGARVPQNATAIIPVEDVTLIDNKIKIEKKVREFQHIRFIGEDIKLGEILIFKGERLNFSKVTLLASQGFSHIKVYKRPKVVVFASGEELKLHFEKIEDYQIYNSNTPTFLARLQELNCDITFVGQAKDSLESITDLVKNSFDADLIITSGGVSVGDADFTKEAFNSLGFEAIFDGIIIKPGKPTVFGKIKDTFILNLPGNPLASAMIFELFGKAVVQKLSGSKNIYHNYILAKNGEKLGNKKGRITLIPGMFDGESFTACEKRGPGMVSVLSNANSMIVLDEEISEIKKDQMVKVLPINWKFFTDEKKDFLTK